MGYGDAHGQVRISEMKWEIRQRVGVAGGVRRRSRGEWARCWRCGASPRAGLEARLRVFARKSEDEAGPRTYETSAPGVRARCSWSQGSSAGREQEELSGRLGPRRRPSAMELGGDLLGRGDGPRDAHGSGTAGADGDIDAKDASQERHPREAMGCRGAQLRLEQGGDGGKLERPVRNEQGELLGSRGLLGPRNDTGAQGVMPREDTIVPNGVGAGRGNQGAQPSEEGVRSHLGIGGSSARGLLEVDADLTVCSALDGILSKRWPQEIATQPLETTPVATVHGHGGMQLHAEGGHEQGRRRRGLPGRGGGGPQRQGELDAGGHGCIDLVVPVVIVVGLERRGVGVHALQDADEVLIGEPCDGTEARFVRVGGFEAAPLRSGVTSACRCTINPRSLRKRWTTMRTPGWRAAPLTRPWVRLVSRRSVCMTRAANRWHTRPSRARSYPSRTANGPGNESTHCRQGTAGRRCSTSRAAVSTMRRPIHEGQMPRLLQAKGTRRLSPQR